MPRFPPRRLAAMHEETEIVHSFAARKPKWRLPALCAVAGVVVGLGAGYALWGGSATPPGASQNAANDGADRPPSDGDGATPSANSDQPSANSDQPAPAASTECVLHVESEPAEAEILVGDEVRGVTPLDVSLPCGEATVILRKARYRRERRTVELAAGAPTPLSVTLDRPEFKLRIESTPPGATVSINGKPAGRTPTTVEVPGFVKHAVVVSKSRYRSFRKPIYLQRDTAIKPRLSRRR